MRRTTRQMAGVAMSVATSLGATASYAGEHAILSTHVPGIVAAHTAVSAGVPDPASRMVLAISLPQRHQDALYALLRALYDPASPSYRRYLSVAEFTARFGPTAADYQAAEAFFLSHGLSIVATAANRGLLCAEGSVADMERVFHVTLGLYRHPDGQRLFVAPDREPALDLAVTVQHVTGLDDFTLPQPRLVRSMGRAGALTGSGPHGYLIGSDVRTAYAGGTQLTGAGQSVGLMELAGYELSDVQAYFSVLKQPLSVPVAGISTDGAKLGCTGKCNDGEQALDIEYAISMAPGLSQVQVYVGHSAEAVLNRMASDNTSKQLSTSWGWSAREYATDHPIFLEMAAQGQTLLTASGDYSSLKASDPWPEEDAFITAVGGTDLQTVSAGGAWLRETGWRDSAGGPALGQVFAIQSYQMPFVNSANGASPRRRNVPDIAGGCRFRELHLLRWQMRGRLGRYQLRFSPLGRLHRPGQPAGRAARAAAGRLHQSPALRARWPAELRFAFPRRGARQERVVFGDFLVRPRHGSRLAATRADRRSRRKKRLERVRC